MPPLTGVFVVGALIYMHANLAKKLTLKEKGGGPCRWKVACRVLLPCKRSTRQVRWGGGVGKV